MSCWVWMLFHRYNCSGIQGECLLNKDNTGFEDSVFYKYIDLNEQRSVILDDIKRTGTVYG